MSNRVLISADCVCDIPMNMAEKLKISMMYYYIVTEEGKFRDKTEIRTEQVLEYLEEDKKRAYSLAAGTEDYREYFETLRKKTDTPIIHLCMSARMSCAHEHIVKAAEGIPDLYIVDTMHTSGGMGYLVVQAAEMANAGACVEMILAMLEQNKHKVQTTAVIKNTQGVFRSGSIAKTPHLLCKWLNLHPMIHIKDGQMKAFGLCWGNPERYAKRYLKRIFRKPQDIDTEFALLMYTSCPEELIRSIEAQIRKHAAFKRVVVTPTNATVSCDLGSGCFGVIYLNK